MKKIPIQCTEKELCQVVKALLDRYKSGILKQFGGINLCAFKNNKECREALINLFERIDPPRPHWRAKKGGEYYFVDNCGEIMAMPDYFKEPDNNLYKYGNYFRTCEEAEIYAQRVRGVYDVNIQDGERDNGISKLSAAVTSIIETISISMSELAHNIPAVEEDGYFKVMTKKLQQ